MIVEREALEEYFKTLDEPQRKRAKTAFWGLRYGASTKSLQRIDISPNEVARVREEMDKISVPFAV